jgi:hypothetical protein
MDSTEEIKPRCVLLVALYIASLLPPDQTEFKDEIMEYVRGTLSYSSPETLILPSKWMGFELIMKKYIKESDYPWQSDPWKQQIVDIYIGKTPLPSNMQ